MISLSITASTPEKGTACLHLQPDCRTATIGEEITLLWIKVGFELMMEHYARGPDRALVISIPKEEVTVSPHARSTATLSAAINLMGGMFMWLGHPADLALGTPESNLLRAFKTMANTVTDHIDIPLGTEEVEAYWAAARAKIKALIAPELAKLPPIYPAQS